MLSRKRAYSQLALRYGRRTPGLWKYQLAGRLAGAAVRRAPQAIRLIRRIARRRRGAYRRQQGRSFKSRSGPSAKRSSQVFAEYSPGTTTANATRWKTFNSFIINAMDRGTGIRERLSGRVFVKGFKICGRIQNQHAWPAEFHWAIVQPKGEEVTDLRTSFFRSTATTTTRVLDFVDDTTVSTWNMQYLCDPINSQKYNIITHRKLILDSIYKGGETAVLPLAQASWAKAINIYIPIKRRTGYQHDASLQNIRPWYLVYWWLPVRTADKDATVKNVSTHWKTETYFSDGRN